jgi:1-hydroxycarotenoid 3,4-desaturase
MTGRVVVVGAGIGGLVTALLLAARGLAVTVCEAAAAPGGKMRMVEVGWGDVGGGDVGGGDVSGGDVGGGDVVSEAVGRAQGAGTAVDAGPTVFTMRWVFEAIFAEAGASLADHITLHPAEILARHAWSETERLDLFADPARSAEAIGAFAGAAEARGFLAFCARARRTYQTLEGPFIRGARPTALSLVRDAGLRGLGDLWRIAPFETLWKVLGEYFADPRLRQLFARYATYCGSSPFLAPATLMLVAHVEQDGVWLVAGGMHRLAAALAALAAARGATLRYGAPVTEILVAGGRAAGVVLADGERLAAGSVVVNADPAALAAGLFGPAVRRAVPAVRPAERSLSAVTWAMRAVADFPLLRHTVFFSDAYAAEFEDILQRHRLPARPTVYICAQDRSDTGARDAAGAERLLCLVNAPPVGDGVTPAEIEQCRERMLTLLRRCGLNLLPAAPAVVTGPAEFARLFPGTGGALYGQAVHGSQASFRRPGARSALPGLYLTGGSTHPGAGVPMAALSGRLAAASVIADCSTAGSTVPSRRAAMRGGMSTR